MRSTAPCAASRGTAPARFDPGLLESPDLAGITVLIISHNNDRGILPLVERASAGADQVIVVDNGSTDRTVPLLQQASHASDKLTTLTDTNDWWPSAHSEWSPLAAARNFGLSHVTQEWVLVLDDDEYVSTEGFRYLRRVVDASSCFAYFLPWITYDGDGKTIVEDYKLSLFRSWQGVQYDGLFHENATKSVRKLQAPCLMAPIEISHNPSFKGVRDKSRTYLEGLTSAVQLTPVCARLRWFFGLTLYHLGEVDDAQRQLSFAATLDEDRWHPIERINACFLLGASYEITHDLRQRRHWLERALHLCEEFRHDVEMVAYGTVIDHMRQAYETITRGGKAEGSYPSHLFYCF
jgi:glycosyltransferase involved in cell wall biosynthesis